MMNDFWQGALFGVAVVCAIFGHYMYAQWNLVRMRAREAQDLCNKASVKYNEATLDRVEAVRQLNEVRERYK